MIITALHFKRNNSGIFHSFKFAQGKAGLRTTWVASGNEVHPQWILEAVKSLFCQSNTTSSFDKIILEACDDAGEQILVEKIKNTRSIYRSGKKIQRTELIEALFGDDIETDTFLPENDVIPHNVFLVNDDGAPLYLARKEKETINHQKSIRSILRDKSSLEQDIKNTLRIQLQAQADFDFNQLRRALLKRDEFKLLLNEQNQISVALKSLDKKIDLANKDNDCFEIVEKIDSALQLINKIDEDHAKSIERKKVLCEKIAILRSETGLGPKEALHIRGKFQTGFTLLSRLELIKKVISILDSKRTDLINHISSPFAQVTDLLNNLLSTDYKAFNDLSEKFTFIESTLLANNIKVEKANSKNQTWFEKFKKPDQQSGTQNSNTIIDIGILTELKKISSDIAVTLKDIEYKHDTNPDSINSISENFEVLYEAYIARLNEVKSQWKKYASVIGAEAHDTFTGFCDFYIKVMQLVSLGIEKKAHETVIATYGNAISTLREQVYAWQELNKIECNFDLTNSKILTREARVITSQRKEIFESRKNALDVHAESSYLRKRKSALVNKLDEFKTEWNKTFENSMNQPSSIHDDMLDELISKVNLLKFFQDQLITLEKKDTITPFSNSGAVISTWMISSDIESMDACDSLLTSLNKNSNSESKILGTDHNENSIYFHKKGCGRIIEIPGVVDLDQLYQHHGIKKRLLENEELEAISKPFESIDTPNPTRTLAPERKTAPVLDLDLNPSVIKARKIQQTLDLLNGKK